MDYEKYSKQEFDKRGLDTQEARELADELENDVAKEMHKVASVAFLNIINNLNAQGHKLELYGKMRVGDIPFRDESEDGICYLRLAWYTVIGTGYADVTPPNPKVK